MEVESYEKQLKGVEYKDIDVEHRRRPAYWAQHESSEASEPEHLHNIEVSGKYQVNEVVERDRTRGSTLKWGTSLRNLKWKSRLLV